MDEKNDKSIQERVERLEAIVAELQSALTQRWEVPEQKNRNEADRLPDVHEREKAGPTRPVSSSPWNFRHEKSFKLPENMRTGEFWLNIIGIGLVLFGVAFLFKYSIDQGWLTPVVRVGFGAILGIGLIIAGLRISAYRKHFSQVLSGGGIATFYITGFAAFQLLNLISQPVAFVLMVSVTLLAFILSLKQDGSMLALIGTIGGLGTPFLLYTGTGSLPGLIGYTCLVVAGTGAVFFFRGWRLLLWTTFIGGWSVLLVTLVNFLSAGPSAAFADRWALQSGIIFCWLVFWTLPLVREFVRTIEPARPQNSPDTDKRLSSAGKKVTRHLYMHVLSVTAPVIALVMSAYIWQLSGQTWGWITLGVSVVYGLISWGLTRLDNIKHLSYTHSLSGVMFATVAFYLLLSGNTLLFVLAAEATVLHLMAHRLSDRVMALAAHFLFGVVGLWLAERLFFEPVKGMALLNMQALTDLCVMGAAAVVSILCITGDERKGYLLFIHIAVLGWFLRELSSLPHGQGFVTIAWGVYAVVVLVTGLRMNDNWLRITGMGTLLIVVGKLFLVDLVQLETIWRILLFLGFGGLFLIVSYYFRALWRANYKSSEE